MWASLTKFLALYSQKNNQQKLNLKRESNFMNFKNMTNRLILIISAFLIVSLIFILGFTGYNSPENFQVIQPITGKMWVQSQGGYYAKCFPTVYTYDKMRTIYYSKLKEESRDNDALQIRFKNKGTGDVSVQVIVKLFSDAETMIKMHNYARGDIGIIEDIVLAKLKEIAMSVASTMSSNEAIENYAKFNEGIRAKILNNAELKEKGISVEQFSITDIDFDALTKQQFKKQQEIELSRRESEANQIKFETERTTAKIQYEKEQIEAEGKAKVVMIKETTDAEREKRLAEIAAQKKVEVAKLEAEQAQIDANRIKEVAIIEATKNKETAALNNEAAKLDAQRTITLAQAKQKELELAKGLSEFDKFRLEIDKQTKVEVAKAWASGIAQVKLPQTFMFGGSNGANGGSAIDGFLNMLTLEKAKTLNSGK